MMRIAVFCASADDLDAKYIEAAKALGFMIGSAGWELVYGGTNVGLMKEVAMATISAGGAVTGVIPTCISKRGLAAEGLNQLLLVSDMKERKAKMRELADVFIALPGGWGTLEEIIETITLKQLGDHQKPIIFLNTSGFYDGLMNFITEITQQGFVSSVYNDLYVLLQNVEDILPYLDQYQKQSIADKYTSRLS